MAETMKPELLVADEGLSEVEFVEVLGDLSISSIMTPQGNHPEGYKDDPPQLGCQRIPFVD